MAATSGWPARPRRSRHGSAQCDRARAGSSSLGIDGSTVPVSRSTSRLRPLAPGRTAAPLRPPSSRSPRVASDNPPLRVSASWQSSQNSVRIGWIWVAKSMVPARRRGRHLRRAGRRRRHRRGRRLRAKQGARQPQRAGAHHEDPVHAYESNPAGHTSRRLKSQVSGLRSQGSGNLSLTAPRFTRQRAPRARHRRIARPPATTMT